MSWNFNVAHRLHVCTFGEDLGNENMNTMNRIADIFIICFPFHALIQNLQF
jgi:hypothetical protein